MIAWPSIPTLTNGMPFSGLHHSMYGEALEYLLGVNYEHSVFWRLHEQITWWEYGHTSWQTLWEGWLLYRGESPTLGYYVELWNEGAYETQAQLQWLDGETWTDLGTPLSATGSLTLRTGGYSVAGLGWNGLVRLRWRVKSADAGHYAGLRMWFLGVRGSLSEWTPIPSFTERVSDASEWNILRDDLELLYTKRGRAPQPLALGPRRCEIEPSDVWRVVARYCCLYRSGDATAGIKIQGPTTLNGARWRVRYRQQGAAGFTTLYTSGNVHGRSDWEWYTATLDLSGLTPGMWYEFAIEALRDEGWGMFVRSACIVREPPSEPAEDWEQPPVWAHGDVTVTVAECQKLVTDANLLNVGGAEELWGVNAAQQERPLGTLVHPLPDPEVQSLKYPAVHTGVRRWRWLRYRCEVDYDESPGVLYGVDLAQRKDLPVSDGWLTYDLEDISGLLIGDLYQVVNVTCALETADAEA